MVFLGTHVPPPPHIITSNRTNFEEVYLRIFLTWNDFQSYLSPLYSIP